MPYALPNCLGVVTLAVAAISHAPAASNEKTTTPPPAKSRIIVAKDAVTLISLIGLDFTGLNARL
jgi:hypothetical protein